MKNGADTTEGRVPHYLSADTAPAGFAIRRPPSVALSFLLAFAALSVCVVPLLPTLTTLYAQVLEAMTGVSPVVPADAGGALSFRPFVVVLLIALSAFAAGTWSDRSRLFAFSSSVYLATILAVDALLVKASALGTPAPFSKGGGVAAGVLGVFVVVAAVFTRYRLPAGVRVAATRRRSRKYALVLLGCAAAALATVLSLVHGLELLGERFSLDVRSGLGAPALIFSLTVISLLFLVSVLQRRSKESRGPVLSVAFLVPAHNEAEGIEACIRALDAAAERYAGPCRLYLVDNASSDDTGKVAARALASARAVEGEVLECRRRGKSFALNFGLARMTEDVVVRVDADTVVSPSFLEELVPHFSDESVGGVTGLSFPPNGSSWFGRMRTIEVYYSIGFMRAAQGALDAIMVMPGVLSSYRRRLLTELGGFGEGFNGEDADITVRIGRLGYRIAFDPKVRATTEMPATLAHLREQRQRWARGLFHMAARNISMIWMRQGVRGVWLLPWAILNGTRRSLMLPVLACAVPVELIDPSVFSLQEVSVVGGFVVSVQLLVIAVLLLAHREFRAIPFVPTYLAFRLFRAFVALEALLTLQLRGAREPVAIPAEENARLAESRLAA